MSALIYAYSLLLGETVEVTSAAKHTTTGILVAVSDEGLVLKYVRDKEGPYTEHPKPDARCIRFSDFVMCVSRIDSARVRAIPGPSFLPRRAVVRDVSDKAALTERFGTDSDIAQNKSALVGRELRSVGSEWTAQTVGEPSLDGEELDAPLPRGAPGRGATVIDPVTGRFDQFATNIAMGVKMTYREELYTSALDKASFTPAQVSCKRRSVSSAGLLTPRVVSGRPRRTLSASHSK